MKNLPHLFILILFISKPIFSQQKELDSIITRITTLSDSSTIDYGSRQVEHLFWKKEFDLGLLYADKLLKLSEKLEYDKGIATSYNQIGNMYNRKDELIKASSNYSKAEKYFKKINLLEGLALVNNNKSSVEQERGNLEKSISYLLEANKYNFQLKDSIGLSRTLNNIGNAYAMLGKFESAKSYYTQSISIKKKHKLKKLGTSLNNMALLHFNEKMIDSATNYVVEALSTCKKNDNIRSASFSYEILAKIALHKNQQALAKKYYDSSMIAGIESKCNRAVINSKQQLGYIAIQNKDFREAEKMLSMSRDELAKTNIPSLLLTNYKYSVKLDSARGQYANALQWQQKYQKLSDKNTLEQSTQKVTQAENRFKAEMEQLKLIDEQEKREQKTKEKLFRSRVFNYIAIGVLIFLSIFLAHIIKTKKERKRLIKKLNDSNQVKNKLFSIISHDLKNEIHGLNGSLNLMKNNNLSSNELGEIIPLLANRTHQTSIMLTNLLNWSKSQMKELYANPTSFDISEVINNKFAFFDPKATQKRIKLINELPPTRVYADKDMFSIVSQNLMANAIKFCNPGDSITLFSRAKGDYYQIGFKDTGIGIKAENVHKLFAEDTFTTNGTQQETGTGLGLRICKELIDLNKGNIAVESKPGVGSTFYITLPMAS
ncbi:hypothetical protein GCM10009430_20300 [Aquimarina litoralis]|uniref:histidine kinase n=1 Tax=Aquimarina litoralis TaxID=584605 RepID=A0ABN1IT00_9FLAO